MTVARAGQRAPQQPCVHPGQVVWLILACLVACLSTAACSSLDRAARRPLTILAPASPHGGWGQTARLMQQMLTSERRVDVPIEVGNRGGAGRTIGLADLVTRHRRNPDIVMIGGSDHRRQPAPPRTRRTGHLCDDRARV